MRQWRKSSYSSGNGQCVEIAFLGVVVKTRDSKNSIGSTVTFSTKSWSAFIGQVQSDAFPPVA
ncbi:DUF397 domain-containing protein [Streptomyces olivoverticillatus]|uniref:DUF397 domain-containing protein n=1 Tax=Streptomyces olivoverticillatus TaxID=66427 RepID=UPI001FEC2ABB|nr:DUF397 domain-containing protein [Streptomyces olivoverticillatus]